MGLREEHTTSPVPGSEVVSRSEVFLDCSFGVKIRTVMTRTVVFFPSQFYRSSRKMGSLWRVL